MNREIQIREIKNRETREIREKNANAKNTTMGEE